MAFPGLLSCPKAELGFESWQRAPGSPSCWLEPPDAAPPLQEKQDKAVLQSEVASLRQNNQRLQEESQAASEQLRKFAEIFCREKKEL